MKSIQPNTRGFTLIELAVVLVIVGLMLGGLIVPFSTKMEQSRLSEARATETEIVEALIGFAIRNGRLPCPDTDGNGSDDGCANTNANATTGGNLPWLDLGVRGLDPWGRPYQYRVNNAYTTIFTLNTTGNNNGIIRICTSNTCGNLVASNVPAVVYSSGKNGATQPPPGADELENTTLSTNAKFDRTFVDHEITAPGAAGGEFDDIVTWLSPNILLGRMVAAGQLP